jgi:cytochrome bd-type quinol oxidase subunit 2
MTEILGRAGLLILACILLFLARRLHSGASGKGVKAMKWVATVLGFLAGLAFVGTIVGGWMATIAGASPYIAAGVFILCAGGFTVDVWKDKQPDGFAFWCAVLLPLAVIYGFAQASNVGDMLQDRGEQVSNTISSGGR